MSQKSEDNESLAIREWYSKYSRKLKTTGIMFTVFFVTRERCKDVLERKNESSKYRYRCYKVF
jgi:hypothetical protein